MKKEGHAEIRVPFAPLFKVYDIRRNLSDKWKKSYLQSAYVILRIAVNRQSGHPVKINGTFP